jgi:hypothetical protein
MSARIAGLLGLIAVLAAGCAQNSGFDSNLKAMVGASEEQLINFMQRRPDRAYDRAPGVRVLEWGRDEMVQVPAGSGQTYVGARGSMIYVPGTPAHARHETCFIEWTIVKGIATQYRREGDDCRPFNNRPGG